ncbi:hypothetical protein GCM10007893_00030 [Paracoccus marinus]|nr:hypothetical protein GCM10007893_00030 [Paracoccus marinus]
MPDTAGPVLGFDTSAAHCAAAVVSGDRVLAMRFEPMAKGQAERLMGVIQDTLAAAGVGFADLAGIGVGVGPGNFTGIRISVAAARGLALSLGVGRAPELGAALRGGLDLLPAVTRFGGNLAFLGNAVPDALAGETLQEPRAASALSALIAGLAPDVTLLLLPPMLEGDAGLAGLPLAHTLLMVADGTTTVPGDLKTCDRLNEDGPPILGVVMVEAEV